MLWLLLMAGHALAGGLHGRVLDEQGLAVPGVAVVAYDQRFGYGYSLTLEDGTFEIVALPPNFYRIRVVPMDVQPWAEQWAPGTLDVCASSRWALEYASEEVPDLVVSSGNSVRGRVENAVGDGVSGARISAVLAEGEQRTQTREAWTDDGGVFTLKGLPPEGGDSTNWALYVEAPAHPRQYMGPSYDAADADWVSTSVDEVDVGAVTLFSGMSVSGHVQGPDGPVGYGDVHVYSPSEVKATAVSEDGFYEVFGLPPGPVLAWYRGDGYGLTYYPDGDRPGERVEGGSEGGTVENVGLVVRPERRFYGQFLGEGDLGGVSMLLVNDDGTVGHGADVLEDGSFEVRMLHPGEYTIRVNAEEEGYLNEEVTEDGGDVRWFTVPEDEDGEASIPLSLGGSVWGVVRDRVTDEPVYGATVIATDTDGVRQGAVFTGSDGTYAVHGLRGGVYQLHVQYDPYCGDDPNWVSLYYENGRHPGAGAPLTLIPGQRFEWNPVVGPDMEQDGMDDEWERENGLDPEVRDGDGDLDGDGMTNLDEYLLDTDPQKTTTTGCSCASSGAPWGWLHLFFVGWLIRRRTSRP